MRENWLLLSIAVLLLGGVLLSGCAAPPKRFAALPIPDSHIIFNPYWNTPVVAGIDRQRWPIVLVSDEANPETLFRETIYDLQGDASNDRDYYYRRVNSTRIRRSGR